jgi:carbon-monoxide dehydrogenase large subunit
MSDTQGRDNIVKLDLALDEGLRFLGLSVELVANMGAYLSHFGAFIPTMAGTSMLAGLYQTPTIYVNVKGVMTNTVPTDAYRGAGRPEAAYLLERFVDHIARETGLTPDEIRKRNFVRPSQIPWKTAFGDTYDSGDFEGVMRQGMEQAGWNGFAARRAQAESRGKWRGIGMATYVEKCGGGNPETAIARFNDDDTLTLYLGNQTNGQGHETAITQVASARLGIDAGRIRIVQGDSDVVPDGLTGGSRMVSVAGAATMGVADKIVGTDRTMSLFDGARAARDPRHLPAGEKPGLDDEFTRTPAADTFPNGCHVCELEIDPDTGTLEIVNYNVVDDFGTALNPLLLQGQVHGGVGQGVGQALTEKTVYDPESGQLLSGSFMDYALPRADIVPPVKFDLHNSVCTTNPLGVKGAGEAGAIGAPPAVVSAIVDAICSHTGVKHVDMPVTAASLWQVIEANRSKKAA